jgi:hypothetical protein
MWWIWMAWMVVVAQAQPYLMNDVAGTLHLPKGWKAKEWSNWDFEAKSGDEALLMRLWLTEYQVPIDRANAKAWAPDYIRRIEKMGAVDAQVDAVKLVDIGGRPLALTDLRFRFGGKGGDGFARVAAFGGAGQTIHIRVVSNTRNEARTKTALRKMLKMFELDKGPLPMEGSDVVAESGFSAVLPPGWRPPLKKERALLNRFTEQLWASKTGTEGCWMGIRPPAIGEPDLMFACKRYWSGSPLDAHSFDAVAEELKTFFFRDAGAEVPAGEAVEVGDRLGVMFRPKDGQNPLRLLTAPYDQGLMVVWGRGGLLDGAGMDAAMKAVAHTVQFTGPDGGHPVVRLDKQVGYYLTHRRTSPVVLGSVVIAIVLVVVVAVRMRRTPASEPSWDDPTEV